MPILEVCMHLSMKPGKEISIPANNEVHHTKTISLGIYIPNLDRLTSCFKECKT